MSLMTHFAKWRTAILKRSPLFTLSRSLLLSKITAPIPDWMETRIEKDLAFYEKSGINSQKIENTLKKTRATGNWEAAKLYRLRIKENRLITQDNIYAIKDRRLLKLLFFFRTLLRKIQLPDTEFLISTSDIFEEPTFLECQDAPVFFISKTSTNHRSCLFPHIVWLNYWSHLRQRLTTLSVKWPFENRSELLFWRGSTTGFDPMHLNFTRQKVIELSHCYPAEIDAAFSNVVQQNKHKKKFTTQSFLEPENHLRYKYLLALDGNCFPGSFFWQLASGSIVFKNDSPFLEWYYEGLKPFVHYIPFAQDGSNLLERKQWTQANPANGAHCAINARKFAHEFLTNEGIATFVYFLLKKYAKLFS